MTVYKPVYRRRPPGDDARISRCEGCGQWCWDDHCSLCTVTMTDDREMFAAERRRRDLLDAIAV